ncbi:hypothetical protein [Alteromonas stellipolaris]|uniref:hypothetical protein n=1 Tax=Alteromonas stellipolaris TaxID=233316 RepID=UPI001DB21788|nr:hypothetical protein [Alteromonas stellipolaris]MBZ2162089.1 hypothetical protein [Alteromonas stellipolaris]
MRKKVKFILLICALMFSGVSNAHDSNIATFQIRHLDDGRWIYEVMTPLYGIDQSLIASSSDKAKLKTISKDSTAYKQRLVAHIKQAFDVKAFSRGEKTQEVIKSQLHLGEGKIKLDDHLSVFIFEILGMPENVTQLNFRISNMANNDSQINILRLIDGAKNKRYLLNHKNNFSGVDKGFFFAP